MKKCNYDNNNCTMNDQFAKVYGFKIFCLTHYDMLAKRQAAIMSQKTLTAADQTELLRILTGVWVSK